MEKVIELKSIQQTVLLGVADANIRLIEDSIPVKIIVRGEKIKLNGNSEDVEYANTVILEMIQTLNSNGSLTLGDVRNLIALLKTNTGELKNGSDNPNSDFVIHYGRKGAITPKTEGQKRYVDTVNKNDIVFSIGPAGTGKTFLSVAFAVAALDNNQIDRIILCRPAVEAGESLGFLPGNLQDKVDPYLAPLYDALKFFYIENKLTQLLSTKIIEVVPLAYMRGRTLDNSYMILDEAQNATVLQMKMFLTRLGIGSRAIITGDITQVDLQHRSESGLIQACEILRSVKDIGFVTLDKEDIVRHPLVMKIIQAYEKK